MRTKTGKVVSAKNNKTAVVLVHISKMHPILRKPFRKSKKFHAHDENNECNEGDVVQIIESKPISKNKRWKIEKVLEKGTIEGIIKEEILGDFKKEKKKEEEEEVKAQESAKEEESIKEEEATEKEESKES